MHDAWPGLPRRIGQSHGDAVRRQAANVDYYCVSIRAAKWVGGVGAYLGVSAVVSYLFCRGMQMWAHASGVSWGMELLIRRMQVSVFATCVFWGALYASAFAKPNSFGRTARIWKHLGWSYFLGLSGCVLVLRMNLMRLPDFESNFALGIFAFIGVSLSIVCFVLALAAWVHLAFGAKRTDAKAHVEGTEPKSLT